VARGEVLGEEVKQKIRWAKIKRPDWTAEKTAGWVRAQLANPKIHDDGWPGRGAVKNVWKEMKETEEGERFKSLELDRPWSAISLSNPLFSIYPEALPYVIKIWAKSFTEEIKVFDLDQENWGIREPGKKDILTIREAIWIGRLYFIFKNSSDREVDIDKLWKLSQDFAMEERILEYGHYPEDPVDLIAFWFKDSELFRQLSDDYQTDRLQKEFFTLYPSKLRHDLADKDEEDEK